MDRNLSDKNKSLIQQKHQTCTGFSQEWAIRQQSSLTKHNFICQYWYISGYSTFSEKSFEKLFMDKIPREGMTVFVIPSELDS